MYNNSNDDTDRQQGKESQENITDREKHNPFKEPLDEKADQQPLQEEIASEQQRKEALTERD